MEGLQPLLHQLTPTISAPLQAWSERDGQIRADGIQGVYLADRRVLSAAVLTSGSHELQPLVAETVSHGETRFVMTVRHPAGAIDPEVLLIRRRIVEGGTVRETLELKNASAGDVSVHLTLAVTPDSSVMDAIKGGGPAQAVRAEARGAEWTWSAEEVEVTLRTDATVTDHDAGLTLTWHLQAPSGAAAESHWLLECRESGAVVTAPPRRGLTAAGAHLRETSSGNPKLARFVERSLTDLDGLVMSHAEVPDARFVAAGAPWFLTLFGRDSLLTARFLLDVDPQLALETCRVLAHFQGTRVDTATAEQPGKILHEVRRAGITVDTPEGRPTSLPPVYYGTIDATPLWISLLHGAWRAGVEEGEARSLLPNLRAALAWLRDSGDSDGDGFLEYHDETGTGLANQGWKDSGDSVRWHDGSLADGPIALVEVQGYAYRAAFDGAELLEALDGGPDARAEAGEWRAWAGALRERFREAFWVSDASGPYPAIALDSAKRPVDSLSSNIGHLLATGILDEEEAALVAARLTAPDMFSGYGIRTISTTNGGYWPLRYHVGSVWTHDTAMAIEGLLEAGFEEEARLVAEGLLEAADRFDSRPPELFGGDAPMVGAPPTPYPASCRPQAWAAASAAIVARALTS
nr:amylo-alpha-1,6-glucosidase [Actinomycetales bacterium]